MALNPYRCRSERARRLSLVASGVAVIGWVIFVLIASDGFRYMRPSGWALLILVPPLGLSAALLLTFAVRALGKPARVAISAGLLWSFSVLAWGLIGDWDYTFTLGEYVGFLVLPPIGAMLAAALWWWVQQPAAEAAGADSHDPPAVVPQAVAAEQARIQPSPPAQAKVRPPPIKASAYLYLFGASYAVAITLRVVRADAIDSLNEVGAFLGEGFAFALFPLLAMRFLNNGAAWIVFVLFVVGTLVDALLPGR